MSAARCHATNCYRRLHVVHQPGNFAKSTNNNNNGNQVANSCICNGSEKSHKTKQNTTKATYNNNDRHEVNFNLCTQCCVLLPRIYLLLRFVVCSCSQFGFTCLFLDFTMPVLFIYFQFVRKKATIKVKNNNNNNNIKTKNKN